MLNFTGEIIVSIGISIIIVFNSKMIVFTTTMIVVYCSVLVHKVWLWVLLYHVLFLKCALNETKPGILLHTIDTLKMKAFDLP